MKNKFIVVTGASSLDTVVVNASQIIEIYELADGCSFIVFCIDRKEEVGIKVTDSVEEILNNIDRAIPFVEFETILKERVFVNITRIISIFVYRENETFIKLCIKGKKSYGLRLAMPIGEVIRRLGRVDDAFN